MATKRKTKTKRSAGGKPGRKLTYRPEVTARVVAALTKGAPLKDAVDFAGVPRRTFFTWLKAGRLAIELPEDPGADKRFAQLARDIDLAVGESKVALVGMMYRDAEGSGTRPGDWRAAEAILKLRAGDRLRRAEERKLRAEARIAEKKADGTYVEKHEVSGLAEFLATGFADGTDAPGSGSGSASSSEGPADRR